jgi:hypothetical protein
MGVLTEEELLHVLNEQGLRHRIKRFWAMLCTHGLLPMSVPKALFEEHFEEQILRDFFVKGIKEHPDGRQEYTGRATTGEAAGAAGAEGDGRGEE